MYYVDKTTKNIDIVKIVNTLLQMNNTITFSSVATQSSVKIIASISQLFHGIAKYTPKPPLGSYMDNNHENAATSCYSMKRKHSTIHLLTVKPSPQLSYVSTCYGTTLAVPI